MQGGAEDDRELLAEPDPERAWQRFFAGYEGTVERAVRRVAADPEEARDLAVDVLARLHEDWPALLERYRAGRAGAPARFRPWLAVVARRLAIDRLRARYGRPTLPRSVARMGPARQALYRALYGERLTLDEAWEALRGDPPGLFPGGFDELAAEARALEDALPRSARLAAAGVRRPERARGGGAGEPGTDPDPVTEPPAPAAAGPEERVRRRAARARLAEILAGLSGEERLLLRAYFLEGATARDVARVTGASSPSRVYDRVHALLSRLRDGLRRADLGPEDLERLMDFDWLSALGARDGP